MQELYAQPVAQGQYVPVALLCMLMVVGDSKQGSGPKGDDVLQNTGGFCSTESVRPGFEP